MDTPVEEKKEEKLEPDKHPGGRPVEYDEVTILVKAEKYLDECVDEPYQLTKTDGEKSVTYENKIRVKIPTIEGLSIAIGKSRETIYDWKEKYPKFSDIIDRLQREQAKRLVENGLSGDYNPTIAKLLLSKHGYIERKSVAVDGGEDDKGNKLPIEINTNKMSDKEIDEYLTKKLNERANGDK